MAYAPLKNLQEIVTESYWRFNSSEQQSISDKIHTGSELYYFWWNELPVAKSSVLKDFLVDLRILDPSRIPKRPRREFDHLVYLYYMISRHNWKIVDVSRMAGKNLRRVNLDVASAGSVY